MKYIIRTIQKDYSNEEIVCLRNSQEILAGSKILKYSPVLGDDGGIIPACGMVACIDGYDFNNSLIVLNGSYVATTMLILYYHSRRR